MSDPSFNAVFERAEEPSQAVGAERNDFEAMWREERRRRLYAELMTEKSIDGARKASEAGYQLAMTVLEYRDEGKDLAGIEDAKLQEVYQAWKEAKSGYGWDRMVCTPIGLNPGPVEASYSFLAPDGTWTTLEMKGVDKGKPAAGGESKKKRTRKGA